jgi:hypothetical protein
LVGVISVFILNIVVTIWVWRNPEFKINGAIRTLLQGSCTRVRRLNIWIHLLVNVLSTLLLCGSNYCMQVLSSPSRAEIDRAHGRRQWLHIGVPSLQNLSRIAPERLLLWLLLTISSVPLHLLFNSVVFINLQANNYNVVPTMENWLYGETYNTSGFLRFQINSSYPTVPTPGYEMNLTESISLSDSLNAPKYKNISTADCFNKYDTQYTSDVGDVFLIQSAPTTNKTNRPLTQIPFLSNPHDFPSNAWRCQLSKNATCDVDKEHEVPRNKSEWAPYGSPVRYCIVEQVPEICKLQFSVLITAIVVVSNFVKAVVIAVLLLRLKSHDALVTLGDAVASFLLYPDAETRHRCLQSAWQIRCAFDARPAISAKTSRRRTARARPEPFEPKVQRWSQTVTYNCWFGTYSL